MNILRLRLGEILGLRDKGELQIVFFATFFDSKLKCNYLLLTFPDGRNNYSQNHLEALVGLLDADKSRIKLTKYSDTGTGFSSPFPEVFDELKQYLQERGIETKIRPLFGEDIDTACGKLHYESSL